MIMKCCELVNNNNKTYIAVSTCLCVLPLSDVSAEAVSPSVRSSFEIFVSGGVKTHYFEKKASQHQHDNDRLYPYKDKISDDSEGALTLD